jgi:hypothetical protein
LPEVTTVGTDAIQDPDRISRLAAAVLGDATR